MSVFCPAATSSRLSTVAVLSTLLSLAACADEVSEPGAAEELGFVFSSFGFHYPTGGEVLGFDLDGVSSAAAAPGDSECAHDDFPGGVDYGFSHFIDRFSGLQQGQIVDGVIHGAVRNGSMTMLMVIGDLDDRGDDDAVTLQLLSSEDVPMTGADGSVLSGSTLSAHPELRFVGAVLPASVRDGVVEAGPFDVRWDFNIQIVESELAVHDAWIRIELLEEGGAAGVLSGVWDLADVREIIIDPTTSNGDAAGFTAEEGESALEEIADAGYDPATDSCTAVTAVFEFEAVSAFVVP